jgi:response regulator NasT
MRILIAENDNGVSLELQKMLRKLGHTVVSAADSREAPKMLRQRACDLAILATELPFGDVLHTAQELARERPLPILMLVENATGNSVAHLSALPVYGCVFQPLRLSQLQAAISVAANRFNETQALSSRVSELEEALETRKLIDRAKGKLMRMGMSEQKAFLSIQARARRTQKSMRAVARAILGD